MVFVLSKNKTPLAPTHEAKARKARTKAKGSKIVNGFQTGDIVKAIVPKGKKIGMYLGKVAIRASGNFNISTFKETIQGINYKYCTTVQKGDGYTYETKTINK